MSNRSSQSPAAADRRSRGTIALAGAGLAAAALAAYANSFAGSFIFDDLLSIPQNPTLRHWLTALVPPGGGVTVTGRPVLNLSFALNYALSGDHVWSYHALNLLIHVGAGLALFGIVRRTLGRLWIADGGLRKAENGLRIGGSGVTEVGRVVPNAPIPADQSPNRRVKDHAPYRSPDATFFAFAIALLWTLHPLQTESVTYVVQRAESLMGLFYLLTLYCFIRGVAPDWEVDGLGRREQGEGTERQGDLAGRSASLPLAPCPVPRHSTALWTGLAFFCCLLGMATKEVMVSAPVMVFLYDRAFVAGTFHEAWRRRWPVHLALAATWIPLGLLVLHTANRGGTAGFGVGVGFWTYAATQFQAVAHYLWLAVWPHPLIVDYGVRWMKTVGEVAPYVAVVGTLVVATLVALIRWPAAGFLGAWFFAILAPTSLIPGTRQTLAEHRMYLALAPVTAAVVLGANALLGRRSRSATLTAGPPRPLTPSLPNSLILCSALVAVAFIGLTYQRNAAYRSDAVIWADTVAKRPGNVFARNNYGNVLSQAGRPADALVQYEAAMRIDPRFVEAYSNAGNALKALGRFPEAIVRYEQALRINPGLPDVQTALGTALEDAGRPAEAAAHYEQALRLDPDFAEAHNDLGLALARAGRLPEAIAQYERALRSNPALADAHDNLGNALRAAGRTRGAIAQYEAALRLQPNFAAARNNLGNAYREMNRLPEAIAQYEQALRLAPSVPEVRNNLGISLLLAGRTAEAIAQFEEALRLDPNLAQVHLNLGIALESAGRSAEAAAQFEAARRLGATIPPLPGGQPAE